MTDAQSLNNKTDFSSFGFDERILRALNDLHIETPTPVQHESIPLLLKKKDLIGCAQTGTGKTAAYVLPLLQDLIKKNEALLPMNVQSLILAPTRELAIQIKNSIVAFAKYLDIKVIAAYGGIEVKKQALLLEPGAHILVATPGRLIDLLSNNKVSIKKASFFVLDEADRMLEQGFAKDLETIVKNIPRKRQTVLLSATLSPGIVELGKNLTVEAASVEISPASTPAVTVEQQLMFVEAAHKKNLIKYLVQSGAYNKILVFVRTIDAANRLSLLLTNNKIPAEAIHRHKTQAVRQKLVKEFTEGKINLLIATDLMARGLDIPETPLVINYEMPQTVESYIHRIGRTGRAENQGLAISFCSADDLNYLKKIEEKLTVEIPINKDHPYHSIKVESKAHS